MFYYLYGRISFIFPSTIVIDVSGFGLTVSVPQPSDFSVGEMMYLYVVDYTSESGMFLYGFKSLPERSAFLKLTSVKGIGPKTALSVLAYATPDRLKKAIEENDSYFLMKIPGLGRKNASQIILDLKGKLTDDVINKINSKPNQLAADALSQLGFKEKEITDVLSSFDSSKMSVEDTIQTCLKLLNKKNG